MLAYEIGTDLTLFLSKWMIASSHTTTFTDTTYMKLYLYTGYASSVYVYTHTHTHTHTHTVLTLLIYMSIFSTITTLLKLV